MTSMQSVPAVSARVEEIVTRIFDSTISFRNSKRLPVIVLHTDSNWERLISKLPDDEQGILRKNAHGALLVSDYIFFIYSTSTDFPLNNSAKVFFWDKESCLTNSELISLLSYLKDQVRRVIALEKLEEDYKRCFSWKAVFPYLGSGILIAILLSKVSFWGLQFSPLYGLMMPVSLAFRVFLSRHRVLDAKDDVARFDSVGILRRKAGTRPGECLYEELMSS